MKCLACVPAFAVLLCVSSGKAAVADEWLCTEESSQRRGNQILSCGIGIGLDESSARSSALANARTEFSSVCASSSDCRDHAVAVTPKRTTCEKIGKKGTGGYKCYRLLSYEILDASANAAPREAGRESADESRMDKRAELECTESVFNKTIDPKKVMFPTCSSKSGKVTPYELALSFYKSGVDFGSCGFTKPGLQGAIDAEADFKSPGMSVQLEANLNKCRMNVQSEREKLLSSLSECFDSKYIARLIDVAKMCGEIQFWQFGLPYYSKFYQEVCMEKTKNRAICSKRADEAYLNYIIRTAQTYLNVGRVDVASADPTNDSGGTLRTHPSETYAQLKANGNIETSEDSSPLEIASDLSLLDHWFFIGFKKSLGKSSFVKSNAKSRQVKLGQVFGFRAKFKTSRGKIKIKVELHVPNSPEKFSSNAGVVTLGADGKTVIVDYEEDGSEETFAHYWELGKEDPTGFYELKFSVEGVPVGDYPFNVRK